MKENSLIDSMAFAIEQSVKYAESKNVLNGDINGIIYMSQRVENFLEIDLFESKTVHNDQLIELAEAVLIEKYMNFSITKIYDRSDYEGAIVELKIYDQV